MTEYLEFAAACDSDQCHAALFGGSDRKSGGGRYGDQQAGPDGGRLLHHLDRDAVGKNDGAGSSGNLRAGKRAGQFIEGIMAAGVLSRARTSRPSGR
jgi:hypothetical protein